jgi:LytS/YehU family sensor histidine kinase
MQRHQLLRRRRNAIVIAAGWLAVVFLFALQWFLYDAAREQADPFRFYLWWSFYTWGVLTPLVVTFAYRNPIERATWKRALPLHIAACFVLVAVEISFEALLGKLRMHHDLTVGQALAHYFSRHAQVSLLTYWLLVGAVELYRLLDEAHKRELRSSRLEAQLSAAQLEVLRAQIHPHFLFNTLQAATTLIHEDPDAAEDMLVRLSELLRISLDESHTHEIALERELEILDLYIGIQARRFGDRLRFEVSVDPAVRDCMVPAMILQPLVENAIRHGIGKHKGTDTVSIRGLQQGEFLRLEVLNLNSKLEEQGGSGIGLANIRARLEQLYGTDQGMRLQRLDPIGVCAEISIPLRFAPVLIEETAQ